MHIGHDRPDILPPGRRRSLGSFGDVLGLEPGNVGADLRITPMPLQKSGYLRAGVSEQRLMDKLDGCGRPLDVQKDSANVLQFDTVRADM